MELAFNHWTSLLDAFQILFSSLSPPLFTLSLLPLLSLPLKVLHSEESLSLSKNELRSKLGLLPQESATNHFLLILLASNFTQERFMAEGIYVGAS